MSFKSSAKLMRLPDTIETINEKAGRMVCDHEKIYIKDRLRPDRYECDAILATHTGNTSLYSFAAEVEYHARSLTLLAKLKVPFFGRSVYSSAIRADMTVDDNESQGAAPFYQSGSKIVKRQRALHKHQKWIRSEEILCLRRSKISHADVATMRGSEMNRKKLDLLRKSRSK